jgi:aminoglycoside 3-N-acetyltransferase I
MSFVPGRRIQFSHWTGRREEKGLFMSALWHDGMAGGGLLLAARHQWLTSGGIEVRVLGAQDLAAARAMIDMFGREFGDEKTYCSKQPDDRYLRRLLESDNFVAVVALAGTRVIGGLAGYVLPKLEQSRSEFYIYDLAVEEAYRRRGVATGLIERLKELAAARGIYVIFVQADHGDDPAIALYTKMGVREDVLHFDISPSPSVASAFATSGPPALHDR